MNAVKGSSFRVLVVMIAAIAAFLVYAAGSANAQSKPVLTGDDCLKCHATAPADLAAAGGKHQGVGCTGCHEGHPPTVKKPIPLCNQCHMGKPHFELKGCLGCHRNPHTPKKITFDSKVTDPCLTCHTPQIEQLKKFKSKHTALFCSTCHSSHGLIPQCTQCHKSHSADITAADCKKCHKPHMPTQVTYSADTPAKYCGSCHKKAFDVLTASGAKHKTFTCAFCHQEKHKMVPKCQDCHGAKHPAAIMAKFPKCGECHKVAHDLNNWTPEAAETTKQAPKKKK